MATTGLTTPACAGRGIIVDCPAVEVLRRENTQQSDGILRMQAEVLQLRAVAAENTRLQAEITQLQKVIYNGMHAERYKTYDRVHV